MSRANADQRAAWNGESGERWVANAARRDAVLAPIGDLLAQRAAVGRGERVLDVGCGCGATTLAAAAATGPTGAVVGADLSEPMLEVAHARAAGLAHVELRRLDAQTDPLGGPYDVAISRFGTMFFDDPTAAFTNVARHLVPGGRMCLVTWQPIGANEWLAAPGAALVEHGAVPDEEGVWGADPTGPGMFALSRPETVRRVLEAAGFDDVTSEAHTVPMHLGATVADAVDYVVDTGPGSMLLDTIPEERREGALAAVRAVFARHLDERGVTLDSGVLLTTATLTR